ncbi:MAG TPA: alpha/beta hydrolase [Thermoguttaceae bacterium]|nr:alpha/beta hydrolase [Thermoguttaceae bacterium]
MPGFWVLIALLSVPLVGCASSRGVSLRSAPQSPLAERLQLTSYWGPQPSDRTMQTLRVCHLTDDLEDDPKRTLEKLHGFIDQDPSPEKVHAFAELAYLQAKEAEDEDERAAVDLYGASVLHSYRYLFDERFSNARNPYDPQYRSACDLYNGALEGALRLACKNDSLVPGNTQTLHMASGTWKIKCVLRGTCWRPEDLGKFKFVSDYEIKGLKNHYRTYGLGVPLIAVRQSYANEPAAAKYYPEDLSFPVTAFLRPLTPIDSTSADSANHPSGVVHEGLLELYDPLTTPETLVDNRLVPLESDSSTPLAYFLSNPRFDLATVGLLEPEKLLELRPGSDAPIMGLYMIQPYEPGKIPVLLVHGLWSSPMTWMEMFNDLRSSREIRERYQFWFYLYPTGQPFWISATQMRNDLAKAREVLDPYHQEPALDQMVLVGHSMGGLVAKMQTINSKDEFWRLASQEPFDLVKADPEVREKLRQAFFFQPNPSIRRVVTIGTPHRGSTVSNQTTQWLLSKLIDLPSKLVQSQQQLFRENRGLFHDTSLLKIHTSIDSLAPDSPIFPVMLASRRPPWVKYHNIIGEVPDDGWLSSLASGSDGVVSRKSSHLDDAESELIVDADHTTVQSHPMAVLEVRRILLEHLAELSGRPAVNVADHQAVAPGRR